MGKTGRSPVDRGKTGSKHHVIVEAHGIPLAATLTGRLRGVHLCGPVIRCAHELGCVVRGRVPAAARSRCRQAPGGSPWWRRKAAAKAKGEP
jgi:hypothetical protein